MPEVRLLCLTVDGGIPTSAPVESCLGLVANESGLPEVCEVVAVLAATAASVAAEAGGCEV